MLKNFFLKNKSYKFNFRNFTQKIILDKVIKNKLFQIYRFNPDNKDAKSFLQTYSINLNNCGYPEQDKKALIAPQS